MGRVRGGGRPGRVRTRRSPGRCCRILTALGGKTALVAVTGPPVEYVRAEGARHAPAGMHVEYVPGVCPAVPPPCYPRLQARRACASMQDLLTCF